ncbi:MAG: 2-oxo acid dehydrogenase subunit E2 [Chloroflexota bacterium]
MPLKGVQKVIATRLHQSLQTAAAVATMGEIDATAAATWREEVNRQRARHLTWTHLVLFALSRALPKHPLLNSSLVDETISVFAEFNIGLAINQPSGLLVVPVIQHANELSLDDLAAAADDLGTRARENKLGVADMLRGTFTLSSYGTLTAVRWATSIINPPQSAILGIGRVEQKAVVRDGAIVARWMLPFSLTYDHRIINGMPAMELMETLAGMFQEPVAVFGSPG